jgi:hypothetical protein
MKEIKCFLVGLCVIFTGVIQAQTGAIPGLVSAALHTSILIDINKMDAIIAKYFFIFISPYNFLFIYYV